VLDEEKPMPRYFFHIRSKETEIEDENGKAFPCAWDAYFHARRLIIQALQYFEDADYEERWSVRISNDEDQSEIIALFPFRRQSTVPTAVRRPA
jgi:hypothetical protein